MSILLFILFLMARCTKDNQPSPDSPMYFPANTGSEWEKISPSELGWNAAAIEDLKTFLAQKNTRSFMILVNGRIAMEEYFNGHTATTDWEWNSAGKTLVSAMTGIAQQENLLDINHKISDYLGKGWADMPLEKENLITVRHLLTMTSGLSAGSQLVTHKNLTYVADAGERWAYSNVFQLLMDVDSHASNRDFEAYFNEKLKNKIGMEGFWNFGAIFKIYHSDTRSMARFGLLALNKGKWKDEQIISEKYFNESTGTSQNINPSYGYLWWLNGKSKFMVPGSQLVFQGYLIPEAPSDMFAALGASDQKLYVIPGKKMVIVRMGDASDPDNPTFASSGIDNALWTKINAVIN